MCRFLGLEIDSREITFNIPKDKLEKIREKLEALRRGMWRGKRGGVRKVAQVVGLLQSVRLATEPIVAILTRVLYMEVTKASTWTSWIPITGLARL